MTSEEIYDALMKEYQIAEPAVLPWGDQFVVGRWENIHEIESKTSLILAGPRVAVRVLGIGNTPEEAFAKAKERLRLLTQPIGR